MALRLDIEREIGHIRNIEGGNWLAIALKRVQDALNGFAREVPAATEKSAAQLVSSGNPTVKVVGSQAKTTGQFTVGVGEPPIPRNPTFPRVMRTMGLTDTEIAEVLSENAKGNFVIAIDRTNGSPIINFDSPYHANRRFNLEGDIYDGLNFIRMVSPPPVSAAGNIGALTQSGTTTLINVATGTFYVGNIIESYNAGSVDPGAYGTYYVYFDDPTYLGGAETFLATTDITVLTQYPYRHAVGKITTVSGGGGTGGGGRSGGCCEVGTLIEPLGGPLTMHEEEWGEWCELELEDGTRLACVPEHPVYSDKRGKIAVVGLSVGEEVVTKLGLTRVTYRSPRIFRKSKKLVVTAPNGHLYWANGVLSHNIKLS